MTFSQRLRALAPDLAALGFYLLLTLLAFWKVLFSREYALLAGGDLAGTWFPWRLVAWGALVQPDSAAVHSMAVLHAFLAAAFMYLFARVLSMQPMPALVAGIIYGSAGFLADTVHVDLVVFYGAIWLPLLLALYHLAVTRRQPILALAAGLALCLAALTGSLAAPLYAALLLAAYAGYLSYLRRQQSPAEGAWTYPLLLAGLAGLLVAAAAAAALVLAPAYKPLAGMPAISSLLSLQPQNMVSLALPRIFAPDGRAAYLGIFSLALILIAMLTGQGGEGRFFALLGLAGLLVAVFGPPSLRSLLLVSFCAALLAAWGMQALLAGEVRTGRLVDALVHYTGLLLGALALVGMGLSIWGVTQSPQPSLDQYYSFLVMLFLAWIALALWRPLRLAPRVWYAIAVAVLLFDLLSFSANSFLPVNAQPSAAAMPATQMALAASAE